MLCQYNLTEVTAYFHTYYGLAVSLPLPLAMDVLMKLTALLFLEIHTMNVQEHCQEILGHPPTLTTRGENMHKKRQGRGED